MNADTEVILLSTSLNHSRENEETERETERESEIGTGDEWNEKERTVHFENETKIAKLNQI